MGTYDRDMPGRRPDFNGTASRVNTLEDLAKITPADLQGRQDGRNGFHPDAPDEIPKSPPPEILTVGNLVLRHRKLRDPVIDGIAREGETVNFVSKSKVGKSWLIYGLALSVCTGRDWLDKFRCRQGKVLLIDNELHPDNLAFRIPSVAEAMGIRPREYQDVFDVCCLRGRLQTVYELDQILNDSRRGEYVLVLFDALYRMLPEGVSENENTAMTSVYNRIDEYGQLTGAVIGTVAHATKGDQSQKDISDVGSGAGSQSRAVDSHIIFRPHEQEGAVVFDGVLRSFAPLTPMVLEWNFPLWVPADDLDPTKLKQNGPRGSRMTTEERFAEKRRKVIEFLMQPDIRATGATKSTIKDHTGINAGLSAVLESLVKDKNLIDCEVKSGRNNHAYPGWRMYSESEF